MPPANVTAEDRERAAWWLHTEDRLPRLPNGDFLSEYAELVESLAEEFAYVRGEPEAADDGRDVSRRFAMVGGKVVGTITRDEIVTLHVKGTGSERRCFRTARIKSVRKDNGTPILIECGDRVWWQAGTLYWTAAKGERDVPVELISHS